MNRLLESGLNISDIRAKYPRYDYWEIYWNVKDYSLLGKKRKITNKLNALRQNNSQQRNEELINEINQLVTEMYNFTKSNGKKLVEIGKIINR